MAKRPASHQLEEKSRLRFKSILPTEWVLRTQTPDYGLDEQVQIVEQEIVTPLLFAVQLKATEKLTKKKTLNFSTERLRDYAALSMPVMIAVYDAVSDTFYYTWSHHLHQRLDRSTAASWLVQESIAIPLSEQLDTDSVSAIIEEVSSYYARLRSDGQTRSVPIAFEYDKENTLSYQQVIGALGGRNCGVRSVTREQASLVLIFSKRSLVLQENDFEVSLSLDQEALIFPAALALLSVGFARVGRVRHSLDCLHTLVTTCGTLPDVVEGLLLDPLLPMIYGNEHRTSESQLLSETLLEAGNLDLGLSLMTASLYDDLHTAQHALKTSRLLKQALALSTEKDQRATILYSLGNNHRSRGEHRAALTYYFKAARESRGYLSKNYWWAEAAGCFFLLSKYRYAEFFYRKALALPGQENTFNRILLADTLFHQGCYQQARCELEEYLTESPPTATAAILHELSFTLSEQFGDKKRDPVGAAKLYFNQLDLIASDILPERAERALQLDPLFAPAHFTLGVHFAYGSNDLQAAWHFLLAGYLNQQDITAWCNACVLFIGLPQEEDNLKLAPAVFAQAYHAHGSALEVEFAKTLSASEHDPAKASRGAKALLELARKCEAMFPQPSATFLRVPNLEEPRNNGGFWFSKDSVPNIL